MPLGSSSEAPVIKPGPSSASRPRLGRRRAERRAIRAASKLVSLSLGWLARARVFIDQSPNYPPVSCGLDDCLDPWRLLYRGASLRCEGDDAWMISSIR